MRPGAPSTGTNTDRFRAVSAPSLGVVFIYFSDRTAELQKLHRKSS